MAGHSKWANIKHRKERADKKKGKLFSRIVKEIISAVKQGGPDDKTNPKLKVAIQKAKEANIPNENIERNIKKASSQDQSDYFEMQYELYGHGGVGILLEIMTDNKNRIASDIRIATNKCGGTIATPGAVGYNFERKGVLRVLKSDAEEDSLFLEATDAGAEDFIAEEEWYTIYTEVEKFHSLKAHLERHTIPLMEAELAQVPKTYVSVSEEDGDKNRALFDRLEGLEDVDALFHNMLQQI